MRRTTRLATFGSLAAIATFAVVLKPVPARAWWVAGGPRIVVAGPPIVVAPRPIYVAPRVVYPLPPPVYVAPPRGPVWVPGHWRGPYWVPPHWA
jgi:hypothetical protein